MASRGRPKVRAPNYTGIGDKNVLEKRAPANPRYAKVEAKLHTGNRWRDDLTFTRPKRKNEFFGRVKSELLVRILDENEDAEESLYNLASENGDPWAMGRQVVVDAGATGGPAGAGGSERKPYVLLDMRDSSDYDAFHIRSALSYPSAYLSRSTNPFTPEILPYVNHPEHIIIVYMDDEKVGMQVAGRLAEKNVENCYLLSGGLSHFAVNYSSYVVGSLPAGYAAAAPTAPRSLMTGSSTQSRAPGTGASRAGTGASRAGGGGGGGGHYGQGRPGVGGGYGGGGGGGGRPGTGASGASAVSAVDSVRSSHRRY